ncbi:hypothetical protein DR871_011745 [Flavobacterium petrolei]|uniref:Uncharacterized protein n=1 Tax=Flavobacterium petrolei TaxID=2259594 RepID=A0A482TW90_9FLAO|nr:hypothetical protein [Flavobacterium petrolei]RYJ51846.1 hypothetical protein DR871_011745 [Flavobacterium petrolei]
MTDFKKDTNNEIFQNAVLSLRLRFPVAEISRYTKESKGNISNFLNDKKPVPDTFLKTFAEAFKIDLKEFGYTNGLIKAETKNPPPESEGFFKEDYNRLINENDFLKETIRDLLKILVAKL